MDYDPKSHPTDHVYLTELLKILVRRFSFDELRMVCFELGLDDESLPAYAKSAFARELLRTVDQRHELERLVGYLQRERSDILLPETRDAARRRESLRNQVQIATALKNAWRRDLRHPLAAWTLTSDTSVLLGLNVSRDACAPCGELVALNVGAGTERWRRTFQDAVISGLACLGDDGPVGVGLICGRGRTPAGALVAVGASGRIHWRHSLDGQIVSVPVSTGSFVGATLDGHTLILLDAKTGVARWRRDFEIELSAASLVADAGALYLPCRAPGMIAVSVGGEVVWRFGVPGALSGVWLDQRPCVIGDVVVTVARQGTVFAVDRTRGTLAWESEVGPRDAGLVSPVGDGQYLYVGARDGLHALCLEDGRPAWAVSTPSPVVAPPAVREGRVCVVTQAGRYYGLDAQTGEILWYGVLTHGGDLAPQLVVGDAYGPYALFANRQGALSALRYPVSAEQHEAAGRWYRAARTWDAEGESGRAARAWETYARSATEASLDSGTEEVDCVTAWGYAEARYRKVGAEAKAAACRRARARLESLPILTLDVEHPPLVKDAWSSLRLILRNAGFGAACGLRVEAVDGPFEGDVTEPQTLSALPPGASHIRALNLKALEHGERVPLRLRLTYSDQEGEGHTFERTLTVPVAVQEHPGYAGLVSTSSRTYVDMEVRVDLGQTGAFDVEVTLGDGRVFSGGHLSGDILGWQPSGDHPRDGRKLFTALFGSSATQRAWDTARAGPLSCRVRLRISPDAAALHALPWELMNDGTSIIAADEHTPFSRYVPVSKPWGSKVAAPPARMLALIANPGNLRETYGLPALDVRVEKFLLARGVAAIDPGALRLDFMRPPITLERLGQALQDGYHLLHIIAHSRINARDGGTELLLEDRGGRVRPVPTPFLCRHLAHQVAPPHLVFLAACHSGPDWRHPSLLTMGRSLVDAGVPAVIAMQGAVHIKTAQALTASFYANLATHGIVDRALNQARNAILSVQLPDVEKPVLFMRLPSGRLW